MKNRKKRGVFLILVIVMAALVYGIESFDYSRQDSYSEIIQDMEEVVESYNELNYNTDRFTDIIQEAKTYQNNTEIFFEIVDLFRNSTLLFDQVVFSYNDLMLEIKFLENRGNNISVDIKQKLDLSAQDIEKGRYEAADIKLKNVSDYVAGFSLDIFYNAQSSLSYYEKEFSKLTMSSPVFDEIQQELESAEKSEDVMKVDVIEEELDNIDSALKLLFKTKEYIYFFTETSIDKNRINDIYDEMIFNFNRRRYEEIDALFKDSEDLYEQASYLDDEIKKLEEEINELPEDIRADFKEYTDVFYEDYKSGSLDDAEDDLDTLKNNLLEYKSENLLNLGDKEISLALVIKNNLLEIFIVIIVIFVLYLIFSKQLRYMYHRKRRKQLKEQKQNLVVLIKKLQTEYYDKKEISKKIFDQKNSIYQKKLVKVTKELALLHNETKIK